MNKRLRKKKRVGEFKELGFGLQADLKPGLDESALVALLDRLTDVVDARQLAFGGSAGGDDKLQGFVHRAKRGSATEADRAAVAAFLERDESVVRHEIGALRDAWYGWSKS